MFVVWAYSARKGIHEHLLESTIEKIAHVNLIEARNILELRVFQDGAQNLHSALTRNVAKTT